MKDEHVWGWEPRVQNPIVTSVDASLGSHRVTARVTNSRESVLVPSNSTSTTVLAACSADYESPDANGAPSCDDILPGEPTTVRMTRQCLRRDWESVLLYTLLG